jgi:hypothetical protein
MATLTPTDVALILNLALDIINAIKKAAPEITPNNIDDALAKRQAEIDALDQQVNE